MAELLKQFAQSVYAPITASIRDEISNLVFRSLVGLVFACLAIVFGFYATQAMREILSDLSLRPYVEGVLFSLLFIVSVGAVKKLLNKPVALSGRQVDTDRLLAEFLEGLQVGLTHRSDCRADRPQGADGKPLKQTMDEDAAGI